MAGDHDGRGIATLPCHVQHTCGYMAADENVALSFVHVLNECDTRHMAYRSMPYCYTDGALAWSTCLRECSLFLRSFHCRVVSSACVAPTSVKTLSTQVLVNEGASPAFYYHQEGPDTPQCTYNGEPSPQTSVRTSKTEAGSGHGTDL